MIPESWQSRIAPRDRRPIYEWAAEHVRLPMAFTLQGLFDVQRSRYLIDVFDALANDRIREVTLIGPVRSGKSMVFDVWLPHVIVNDPGTFLYATTTDKLADDAAEMRTMPILEMCEPARALFPGDRHKLRDAEIVFSHGMAFYMTGSGLSNFQQKGARYLVCDETWQWKAGLLGQAKARLGDFEKLKTSKLLVLSQGGVEDDQTDEQWEKGTMAEWHVPCKACGFVQQLEWEGVRSDRSRFGMRFDECRYPNGDWIISKVVPTARWECVKCGHPHTWNNHLMQQFNLAGRYIPTNTDSREDRVSYHVNSLMTREWELLVTEWLEACNAKHRGGMELIKIFYQKRIARAWTEQFEIKPVMVATYEIETKWVDESCRFLTVDVQEREFWAIVRAWAKSGASHLLWAGRLNTWEDVAQLQQQFKVYNGGVLIDSSYDTRKVYEQCVLHGHVEVNKGRESWVCWRALNGEDRKNFPFRYKNKTYLLPYSWPPSKGDPMLGKAGRRGRYAPVIFWSNPTIKDILARLRDGKGAPWVAPDPPDPDWNAQMFSERRIQVIDKYGMAHWHWEKIGHRPNHLWDCEGMQVVAACMVQIIGERIEEEAKKESIK